MKRARGESLTGGTGDVNPQWMTLSLLTLTANNQATTQQTQLPVTRTQGARGKATIIEILKVQFFANSINNTPAAGGDLRQFTVTLSTAAQASAAPSIPNTIAYTNTQFFGAFSAGQSFYAVTNYPIQQDLTDGAGHGVLVATDSIYLNGVTFGYAAQGVFGCRILYRFKDVSLTEYIGIVQSQQQPISTV